MTDVLKQVFKTPCGAQFDTKAEALDFLRKPKVMGALVALTAGNEELADFLFEQREGLAAAFETGIIRRVSKSEYNKLDKALEALAKIEDMPALKFLQEHAVVVRESFRWPTVKRLSPEEKAEAAKAQIITLTEGNAELADWIVENKDGLLEAFEAGKEKRQVSDKAQTALAEYRAKKAAEKAAAEAAKAAAEGTDTDGSEAVDGGDADGSAE
jgi:dsDNA-binding SOS-regulon protein